MSRARRMTRAGLVGAGMLALALIVTWGVTWIQAAQQATPQAGRAVPEPWANVVAYGAVGDGSTDDTPAFHRALKSGLPVLIPRPAQAFVVSKPLVLESGQVVTGVGRGLSIIKYTGTDSCFTSDPSAKQKTHRITLRDFTIQGTGNPEANGITLVRSNNATIQGVYVNDIGGIGIVIDGQRRDKVTQAHYAFIQDVEIRGRHKIGIQLRGRGVEEGTNRHRIVFVRVNGSTDAALDIWKQSNTSNFFGFAVENVATAARIAGRHNFFYGFQVEKASGHGVEFIRGARNNQFQGTTMSKVSGQRWQNRQFNEKAKGDDDED